MELQTLNHYAAVQAAAQGYAQMRDRLVDLCLQLQQIPAPTGAEGERARWVEDHFRRIGLHDIGQDDLCNVYGRIAGEGSGPLLLVSAHTDTVFPSGTDLSVRRNGNDVLAGPGIGDNSAGVVGLLILAETLLSLPTPPVDIWMVANSNEEGLGDLKGMRAAVTYLQEKAGRVGAVVVLEGMGLGRIVHQALGVRRYRIEAKAPGGHSWGDFGSASAIHALASVAAEIARMKMPKEPRTSFNIGKFNGGTSVNTIAEEAALELDLRSTDPVMLARVDQQVQEIVQRHQENHTRHRSGVEFRMKGIGDRPAGEIAEDHPLVQALSKIMAHIHVTERTDVRISSTDANIPLSQGIPSVCIGLTEGGDAHRLSEWIHTEPLVKGMQQLLYFVWWTAAWLTTEKRNE
jgi:acetylornithine deacetylase/succinyl-diaminopimelate desuccinylase-like protein